MAAICKPEN